MCGIEQTRYDHWVTDYELGALAQRYPAAKRFLEGVAAFKDLRPPVALAALVAMQLQRLHEGRAMAPSFLFGHYLYETPYSTPPHESNMRVVARYTTPFLNATHGGFVAFHMSEVARLRLARVAEDEGVFLAVACCCGEIFEGSPEKRAGILLDRERIAKEDARMKMYQYPFARYLVDGVGAVPEGLDLTPAARELHAEFERAMEWLCGPVSEAGEPFTSDQHISYVPPQMTV
ncbi:hypothetical protein KBD13_02145 [Patescibacteria group bacterium]|nr:hypothetical protein [Patescibacteria group bacterium]